MSITIAEADVKVTARGDGVADAIIDDVRGAEGRASTAGGGIGRSIFGGVVGGFAAIGGAQAIGSFFTGAISGASDLGETVSKTTAIFGDQTQVIRDWAANSAQTVGMSEAAAMGAAASFGDMFTQIGFTGEAAASMSTGVVQAAADLGSFSNLDTADVADRMSAAFRGEYDSLQAVIPNINAARVESEALAATGKDTAASLTAQERAAAVLAIVQQDGARAMGDFARTSDGAANASRIATAELENQQAALGQQLLPAWSGLLGFINTVALPAFGTLVTWLSTNADTVLMLAGVIGGAVVAYGLITTAMGIHAAFTAASAAATGGMTFAQWALNAALSANPIGLVITLIAVLVGAIIWVATQTTFFSDAWAAMTSFVSTVWSGFVGWLQASGNAIASWWTGLWAGIGSWLQTTWNGILTNVANALVTLRSGITNAINGVRSVWNGVWSGIGSFFGNIWRGIMATVNTVAGVFGRAFNAAAAAIRGAFSGVVSTIRGVINGIIGAVNGAIGGINGAIGTVGAAFGISVALPSIPMLARGTNFAPDTFIAGERGPELITGARGATVTPYSETRDRLAQAGQAREVHAPIHVHANDPELAARAVQRRLTARLGV